MPPVQVPPPSHSQRFRALDLLLGAPKRGSNPPRGQRAKLGDGFRDVREGLVPKIGEHPSVSFANTPFVGRRGLRRPRHEGFRVFGQGPSSEGADRMRRLHAARINERAPDGAVRTRRTAS